MDRSSSNAASREPIDERSRDDGRALEQTNGEAEKLNRPPRVGTEVQGAHEAFDDLVRVRRSEDWFRKLNAVRSLTPSEDGQVVSRLSGVYGFVKSETLTGIKDSALHERIPVHMRPSSLNPIELHITDSGNVVVLVYVSEGGAGRLSMSAGVVGDVVGCFSDRLSKPILASIPASRIRIWRPIARECATIHVN